MRTISNPKRGCGFLKRGAVYARAELGEFGVLPAFVTIDPPIPWCEGLFRSPMYFNGLAFEELAIIRQSIDARSPLADTVPGDDALSLRKRLRGLERSIIGAKPREEWNLAAMTPAMSFDLLDWVGESFYETPESFVEECRTLGMNRRLARGFFPKIAPGVTRFWFVHPAAIPSRVETDPESGMAIEVPARPGLIGYSYLTGLVYTVPKGEATPESIKEKEAIGAVELVDFPEDGSDARWGALEPNEIELV